MIVVVPVIAALCGAIVGSSLTAVLVHLATSRRELRENRLAVLIALMKGRGNIFSEDVAGNANIIPILFHDQAKVRRAYLHFCALPNGPSVDINRRYDELVLAIAASLGFRDLSAADVDLGFYPQPTLMPTMPTSVANTRITPAQSDPADNSDRRP